MPQANDGAFAFFRHYPALQPYTLAVGTITTEHGTFRIHVTDDPEGSLSVAISNAADPRSIAFSGDTGWTEDGYRFVGPPATLPYTQKVRDAMVAICATQAAAYTALRTAGLL